MDSIRPSMMGRVRRSASEGALVSSDPVSSDVEFRSLDGLRLRGTLTMPPVALGAAAVLVHGGGVTREEGGFFARFAAGLAEAGMPVLRFDFRAHGESDGRPEDLTIAGVANDIRAAVRRVRDWAQRRPTIVLVHAVADADDGRRWRIPRPRGHLTKEPRIQGDHGGPRAEPRSAVAGLRLPPPQPQGEVAWP